MVGDSKSKSWDSSHLFALKKLAHELSLQRKLIGELNEQNVEFHKKVIQNNKRFSEWIAYFDKSLQKVYVDFSTLEKKMLDSTSDRDEPVEMMLSRHKNELMALSSQIKQELEVFIDSSKLNPGIINVDNVSNVNNVMQSIDPAGLSNPEKWLVGMLFNAETPLSYAQIAERTGKTVSTIRVYMNQLKIKGFVEESSLPNGIKIFGLSHDAKVKKLYNL